MQAILIQDKNGDLIYTNSDEYNETLHWLCETLSSEDFKIVCSEAGGNFYVSYIIFTKQTDLNLFLLATKHKCEIVSDRIVLM